MTRIEDPKQPVTAQLDRRIRDFWSRNVNAERIMGRTLTSDPRGSDGYFEAIGRQRYRSHRHLIPWIESMRAGTDVLEIGSGIGLDCHEMLLRGLRVTAVDYTEIALKTLSERLRRTGQPASLAAADACRLPFQAATFDHVYSFGVLHHVTDTAQAVAEVHRVLKPRGQALIMLYNRHSLNELVHRVTGVPFEDRHELCPVVRRYTVPEVRRLFRAFADVVVHKDFVYGEGYGRLFSLTPLPVYRALSRWLGWHLMIRAVR